jgi:hypothetical protein
MCGKCDKKNAAYLFQILGRYDVALVVINARAAIEQIQVIRIGNLGVFHALIQHIVQGLTFKELNQRSEHFFKNSFSLAYFFRINFYNFLFSIIIILQHLIFMYYK